MGYDLSITRADSFMNTLESPISEEDWLKVAKADPSLRLSTDDYFDRSAADGRTERFHPWLWIEHPEQPPLWFVDGAVTTKNPDDATISKLVQLARALNARVIGEEDEEYTK